MGMKKTGCGILFFWTMMLTTVFAEDTPQAAYEQYVQSIKKRNFEGFVDTITHGKEFHYINSHGRRTDSRQKYLDDHSEWFKKTNWGIDYESPLIVQNGDAAYAMAVFHYRELRTDGKVDRLDAYFTLIMFKEKGEWKVVADIVTPILKGKNEN